MSERAIVDTGPLVAFFDRDEERHAWATDTFHRMRGPLLTCEPVVTEAAFLLRAWPSAQDKLLDWVAKGTLGIPFVLAGEAESVRRLRRKYHDVPMSLADACLVRMAEMFDGWQVCTLDGGFRVYRKHGDVPIPLIAPEAR